MPRCQGFLSPYRLEHNNLVAASWLESPACTHAQIIYLNSTNQQDCSNSSNLKHTVDWAAAAENARTDRKM